MARNRNIQRYLRSFQRDMKLMRTNLHRAQVERIYHHEPWMGRWRAYYDHLTQTAFARRINNMSRELEFAFPPDTPHNIRLSILDCHSQHDEPHLH